MEDVEKLQMTLVIEEQNSIIKEQQELLADMQKELSKANDKLKKIEEYIKNKQVIDLDYVEKIIKGDEEK